MHYRGYAIDTRTAVDLLRSTNPRAAEWWETNASHLFKKDIYLMFEEECCLVEDPASSAQAAPTQ
jgi:hypothetical protein